ncbi:MAG: hypothetical protein JW862_04285 [Anaerolineales bacterium]|nr:hypothetical protein [Anaerolineales bacterium]
MLPLLTTKLRPPNTPTQRVDRPQLLARLDSGLDAGHPVLLVSAPAGFGKTTCLGAWVAGLREQPVAWLSLEAADDDPGRFFLYLLAALQQVASGLGGEIEPVLRAGQLPPAEILAATLVNDLAAWGQTCLLVLDDFQVIQDPNILAVMGQWVDHLPVGCHLVLGTREDPPLPLARLRAQGRLTEIRVGDLRFSAAETEGFLQGVMGLPLAPGEVKLLAERTEGWPAGLHLVALSLRNHSDAAGFIASLHGSQRFILTYLTEEVLDQQPSEVLDFLLQTAILERLSPGLCQAVTGRPDSRGMLQRLLAENLFLLALDETGEWYRYHPLFADLLRALGEKAPAIETAQLHRRASRWYQGAGMLPEAIQHALAGADYETAVRLIESQTMDLLMQWHIKTVDGWAQEIPPVWIEGSPRANLVFAWLYLMRADPLGAGPYLARLFHLFSQPGVGIQDPALLARWLALQAMLLKAQGKADESLALAAQALEIVPQEEVYTRAQIYVEMAGAHLLLEDKAAAIQAYERITQLSLEARNSTAEMLGISGRALLAIQQGELHYAFEIVSQALQRLEHAGLLPPISMALYGELGTIHYQWHQLEEAHHHFQRAIQVGTLSGYSDAALYYGVVLSRLHQIEGDLEAAAEEIHKTLALMQIESPAVVGEEVIAQQVRVELALERQAAAEAPLRQRGYAFTPRFEFPDLEGPVTRPLGLLYISALRVLLHRALTRGELASLAAGLDLAGRLIEEAYSHDILPLVLELRLLRARMRSALGQDAESLADIARAVELAEAEGFITVFVEEGPAMAAGLERFLHEGQLKGVDAAHARKVLAAFGLPPGVGGKPGDAGAVPAVRAPQRALVEPLTEREIEVLVCMAEGLTYAQIAGRLYISLNTVRTHVKALYAKLAVNNRTQAIAVARELGML